MTCGKSLNLSAIPREQLGKMGEKAKNDKALRQADTGSEGRAGDRAMVVIF